MNPSIMIEPVSSSTPALSGLTPLRALIVEHGPHDGDLILSALRQCSYHVDATRVGDQETFRDALGAREFDVVLANYSLPTWRGLQAIAELRRAGREIPLLIVGDPEARDPGTSAECARAGATDYVPQEQLSRLGIAVMRAVTAKTVRDENKAAYAALHLSEAGNLAENAVHGISRVFADGAIFDANQAFLRIIGCANPQKLKTLNFNQDLFRFPEQHAELMAACREKGDVHGAETEWRRCDGGVATVRLHVRRLSAADEPGAFEVTAVDVTELRLLERQLRQAQKFEAVGELAGGVAHDFNNVIGAILGWAELGIDQSKEHPAIADRFVRIREQAERAAALTRELLTFARRRVMQPQAVDLNTVVNSLYGLLSKTIPENIEIKVATVPLDPVKADPSQIEQVLMNLCLNARDAIPAVGRIVIETEMAELDEAYCRFYPSAVAGHYAVISVSDTGVGMDTETRERIFEPFFTTKERGKGTGMGLATAYGIVKQHGGLIHVYSEPGNGSLFRVYLPVMEGSVMAGAAAKTPSRSLSEMRGTETIVLAEDDDSIREMARQTLMSLGYRVLSAGDGEEALRLCDEENPSLAILDVVMPKLGGAPAAIQLAERFPNIQILFTSGYSAESGVVLDSAPRRFLQKPYSPTTLARLSREILDESTHESRASKPV
jgi:two-component system cell cycle sensor histidine kinase/response regulator CckA